MGDSLTDIMIEHIPSILAILSFSALIIINVIRPTFQRNKTKSIINSNVEQVKKICDKLNMDVDKFNGTESDKNLAVEMKIYFEEKLPIINALRSDIQSQLIHVPSKWPFTDEYSNKIKEVLSNLDQIVEICGNPTIPQKYQLSIWHDKRNIIQSNAEKVVTVASNL